MDPRKILQMKAGWDQFNQTHPKVKPFLKAVEAEKIRVGTIIEVKVTTPEGKEMESNIRVQASDIELFESFKN